MALNNLQSEIITSLRFPLIVGIVFAHISSFPVAITSTMSTPTTVYFIFSKFLPHTIVFLFFFISGLLFFLQGPLTRNTYKRKLTSRVHSLLIPYILWNIILIGIYCIETYLYTSRSFIHTIKNFSSADYYRVACQMWYVRDLFFMILLTPFIEKAIQGLKHYWIILLAIVWYFSLWPFKWAVHFPEAIFFFSCGAYFGLNKLTIPTIFSPKYTLFFLIAYIAFGITAFYTLGMSYHSYFYRAGIICGEVFILCVAGFLTRKSLKTKKKSSLKPFLAEASFFIYFMHVVLLHDFERIFHSSAHNEVEIILIYFLIPLLTIFSSLLLYSFCRKVFPRTTKLLMGNR